MGEHDRTLGHRVDIHRQAQIAQILQEGRIEQGAAGRGVQRGQIGDILLAEAERLHQVGQLGHAAGHRVASLEGIVAEVHGEAGLLARFLGVPVALGHGDLVQIGEQRVVHVHE